MALLAWHVSAVAAAAITMTFTISHGQFILPFRTRLKFGRPMVCLFKVAYSATLCIKEARLLYWTKWATWRVRQKLLTTTTLWNTRRNVYLWWQTVLWGFNSAEYHLLFEPGIPLLYSYTHHELWVNSIHTSCIVKIVAKYRREPLYGISSYVHHNCILYDSNWQ